MKNGERQAVAQLPPLLVGQFGSGGSYVAVKANNALR